MNTSNELGGASFVNDSHRHRRTHHMEMPVTALNRVPPRYYYKSRLMRDMSIHHCSDLTMSEVLL